MLLSKQSTFFTIFALYVTSLKYSSLFRMWAAAYAKSKRCTSVIRRDITYVAQPVRGEIQ
jgi:hypothetical protein